MSEMLYFVSCLHFWEYRLSELVSLRACWFYYRDITNFRNRILNIHRSFLFRKVVRQVAGLARN